MVRGNCDFVEVVESSHMQFEFLQRQVVVLRLVLVAELVRLCQIPLHLARQPALHTITSRLKYIIRRRPPHPPHPLPLPSPRQEPLSHTRPSLFGNKYLRMVFKHFCKQSYNTKGLFGEYEKEADKMNLNKWMVFCKEFSFTEKFSKKEIIDVFHAAGKFSINLLVEDFLNAVAILQEKHIVKDRKSVV